jgi:hypothetical protein
MQDSSRFSRDANFVRENRDANFATPWAPAFTPESEFLTTDDTDKRQER